jgi:hypothetical protein
MSRIAGNVGLGTFLCSVALLCPAQAPKAAPPTAPLPSGPPAAVQPAPMTVLKKTVAFLTVYYMDGANPGQKKGTAFFVMYEDKRISDNGGFVYLVTNRHMVEPGIEDGKTFRVLGYSLRMDFKAEVNGQTAMEGRLPIGVGPVRWYTPDDASVDLAVMPFSPDETKFDYQAFPVSMIATRDVLQKQTMGEGAPIVFTGFFYQFSGQKKIEPIVREGILSMMPEEQMMTTLHRHGDLYLADAHALNGNSGSPVYVSVGGLIDGSLVVTGGFPYRLLGVLSGYMKESGNPDVTATATVSETGTDNTGITTIVPAEQLINLLDSPALQQLRDSTIAARNASKPAQ